MPNVPIETQVARSLRALLATDVAPAEMIESPILAEFLVCLEYFLPKVLSEIYDVWKYESLDGFDLNDVRKLADRAAEFTGLCILISDQTLTPFNVRLRIAQSQDSIEWMECRLGQRGNGRGGMLRYPIGQSYLAMENCKQGCDWVYRGGFGTE